MNSERFMLAALEAFGVLSEGEAERIWNILGPMEIPKTTNAMVAQLKEARAYGE